VARDPSSSPKDVWECLECGEQNPLDESYCNGCGYHQDGTPPEEEDEEEVEE
jgi:hypothetical protein